MELESDQTSEETLYEKNKIMSSLDSSSLNTKNHKSIPDTEVENIEFLTNGIIKISKRPDCKLSSTEVTNHQEVQYGVSNKDNQEQYEKHMACDCSRDLTSNSHCACFNNEAENRSDYPEFTEIPGSLNESLDASRFDEIINVDLRRTQRSSKRRKDSGLCCPVCGLTLRLPELELHFNQEVEKLSKIPRNRRKPKRDDSGINTTYVQVRSNRLNRLTAKISHYTEKAKKEVRCPVCKLWIYGSEEEMNNHVALCFQNDESDEPINVEEDEDDNESFGEYEFGDQTRIRAISLVPGGYRYIRSLMSFSTKMKRIKQVINSENQCLWIHQFNLMF